MFASIWFYLQRWKLNISVFIHNIYHYIYMYYFYLFLYIIVNQHWQPQSYIIVYILYISKPWGYYTLSCSTRSPRPCVLSAGPLLRKRVKAIMTYCEDKKRRATHVRRQCGVCLGRFGMSFFIPKGIYIKYNIDLVYIYIYSIYI